MTPLYDLTLLLDTAAPDDRREKILGDVESAISAAGTIEGRHDWGPRNLVYEINHKADADYHLFQFTGTPDLLEQLKRSLRVTDGVMRFRIIKLKPGTPPPPSLRSEVPIAAAGDTPAEAAPSAPAAEAAPAAEPAPAAESAPPAPPAAEAETAAPAAEPAPVEAAPVPEAPAEQAALPDEDPAPPPPADDAA
jgi:small subunit ribosomal protein S6